MGFISLCYFVYDIYKLSWLKHISPLHEDEKSSSPRFQALGLMAEDVSEICLHHPVAVKYVDIKWRKRGFKYIIALILQTLLFHVCLMVYTTRVIGVVDSRTEIRRKYWRIAWRHVSIFLYELKNRKPVTASTLLNYSSYRSTCMRK